MTVVLNGKTLSKVNYTTEKQFEEDVLASSKTLFGSRSVYIDTKKKIESKTLGATIPDGFLFDFNDPTDPQFYLVEVELSQHGFFGHIFPQITKFFAFYKNNKMQKTLVDKLHSIIDNDKAIRDEIKKYISSSEIYKFLSDIVETSQNILLIADDVISEFDEISETYTDTWGRIVRFIQISKYEDQQNAVYCISPDFEIVQYGEVEKGVPTDKQVTGGTIYTEGFHLDNSEQIVRDIYNKIKDISKKIDENLIFNPQKYYISIKGTKNLAYMEIRKKKIRFIALLPEATIREITKKHNVVTLSEPVQKFYNSPCASVDINNVEDFQEIENLISTLSKINKESS